MIRLHGKRKYPERHPTGMNPTHQIETQPTLSTSSSTDTGSGLVSQTETLYDNTSTEIRVSIIGKTGVGKSALGNALLQQEVFKSQQRTSSVTSECGSGQRHLQLNGVHTLLKVVDTPGLFDTGKSNQAIAKEIVKCINLLSPGPHLFIFVFRIDYRLSQEDIQVLEYFKNTFGELIDKCSVVVFTGKDQLDNRSEKDAICEFRAQLSTFSYVLKQGRFATINNKDKTEGKMKDVDRIVQLLQITIQNNGGDFYKNEMYEEARKIFEARIRDEEEVKEKALAELNQLKKEQDKMTQENHHLKRLEEEQKQRERDLSKRELELKRKENMMHVQYQEISRHAKRRKIICRREKGKMLPEDNSRIISNYVYLTENLDPLDPLLDILYEKQVLNEDDLEKIRRAESKSTKAMIRQFLDILRNCGINAYSKFIHCLNKSGYGAVAEKISSDIDMGVVIEREVVQLKEEKKYLQLQKRLQQMKREKQESEKALHISAKENRRTKTTLNSLKIALKTKTSIFVRFKSEMRTKTKLLDQLKEERDSRNEDLQMTKVRNTMLLDELDRIYEQNVIIDRIKEEFEDDNDGQDQGINESDHSPIDNQPSNWKLMVKQEPLDVHETCYFNDSLPIDDKPVDKIQPEFWNVDQTDVPRLIKPNSQDRLVDSIEKGNVVNYTGMIVKQEPRDIYETCGVTQPVLSYTASDQTHGVPTTLSLSTTRSAIDQTHGICQTSFMSSITKQDLVNTDDQKDDVKSSPVDISPISLQNKLRSLDSIQPHGESSYLNDKMTTTLKIPLLNQPFVMYEAGSKSEKHPKAPNDDCLVHEAIKSENKPTTKNGNNVTTHDVITNYNKTTYSNIINKGSIRDTCLHGSLDDVNNLIHNNIDLNVPDDSGQIPVFYCIMSDINPVEKVKLLSSAGVRLDLKGSYWSF